MSERGGAIQSCTAPQGCVMLRARETFAPTHLILISALWDANGSKLNVKSPA